MYAKIKLNLRLELRFHNDFTKKIVQFAEQTNKTYLFLSLLRLNCDPAQSFTSHEFPEHIFSSLYFFITTYAILRMLNSIVISTTFPDFHAFKYGLAKPSTSLNLKILLIQGTQATPASSPQKIASPGWRPSWAWYLAAAPALSVVAGNSVPALLSGSSPPEKKNL